MSVTVTESEFTRIRIFQSGKVHRAQNYGWGIGGLCTDRYMLGQVSEGLVSDLTCEKCIAWGSPTTYEIRVPDKRYKVGYRMVSTGVGTYEEAERMREDIGDPAYIEEIDR